MNKKILFTFLFCGLLPFFSFAQKIIPNTYPFIMSDNWINGTKDGKLKKITLDDLKKNIPVENPTDKKEQLFTQMLKEVHGYTNDVIARPLAMINLGDGVLYFYITQTARNNPYQFRWCLSIAKGNDALSYIPIKPEGMIDPIEIIPENSFESFELKTTKADMIKGNKKPVVKFEVEYKFHTTLKDKFKKQYTIDILEFINGCDKGYPTGKLTGVQVK